MSPGRIFFLEVPNTRSKAKKGASEKCIQFKSIVLNIEYRAQEKIKPRDLIICETFNLCLIFLTGA